MKFYYPKNNGKYEIIQALRFIAVLIVIIVHSMVYTSQRLDSQMIT